VTPPVSEGGIKGESEDSPSCAHCLPFFFGVCGAQGGITGGGGSAGGAGGAGGPAPDAGGGIK
jgi:hypothetical protein